MSFVLAYTVALCRMANGMWQSSNKPRRIKFTCIDYAGIYHPSDIWSKTIYENFTTSGYHSFIIQLHAFRYNDDCGGGNCDERININIPWLNYFIRALMHSK